MNNSFSEVLFKKELLIKQISFDLKLIDKIKLMCILSLVLTKN